MISIKISPTTEGQTELCPSVGNARKRWSVRLCHWSSPTKGWPAGRTGRGFIEGRMANTANREIPWRVSKTSSCECAEEINFSLKFTNLCGLSTWTRSQLQCSQSLLDCQLGCVSCNVQPWRHKGVPWKSCSNWGFHIHCGASNAQLYVHGNTPSGELWCGEGCCPFDEHCTQISD